MKITVEFNGRRRDFGEFEGNNIQDVAKQITLTYEGPDGCGSIVKSLYDIAGGHMRDHDITMTTEIGDYVRTTTFKEKVFEVNIETGELIDMSNN